MWRRRNEPGQYERDGIGAGLSISDLSKLGGGGAFEGPRPGDISRATVLVAPADEHDAMVVAEDFATSWPTPIPANHWRPRGSALPEKGDIGLLIIDRQGDAWFVEWDRPWVDIAIPTTLPPSGPAGGDLAGTYPNPTLNPPFGELAFDSITLSDGVSYDLGASDLVGAYGNHGFTSAANGSGKKLVVPRTGLYRLSFDARVDFSTAAWSYVQAQTVFNGTVSAQRGYAITSGYGTADTYHKLSFEAWVNLTAGDALSAQAQASGQAVTLYGSASGIPSAFTALYIGPAAVAI